MDIVFFGHLTLMIVSAAVFALVARRLRLPTIVAYLLAGLLLGPATGWVELTESLELLSELGIVLLLFLVGLELSLDKVKGLGVPVLVAGLIQVVVTGAGGFAIAAWLEFSLLECSLLAMALVFSSTVLAVKLLEERHELDHLHGRIAIGILLLQDLLVIILLTLMSAVSPGGEVTARMLGWEVATAFGGMGLMVVVVVVAARFILPRPFAWAARSPTTLLVWSLCWCFFVVAGAHALHLSPESGAFLAGFGLAQLPYSADLRRRVHPLMNFFIALFFVSLGIQMEFGAAVQHWVAALALVGFAMGGKFLIILASLARLGFDGRTSMFSAITLTQISEFSLILTASAAANGWVDGGLLSLVGVVALITISGSACLIVFQERIYAAALRRGLLNWIRGGRVSYRRTATPRRQGHIIVIGMNTLGRDIAKRLDERGETVLAIDTDPEKLAGLPCETCLGNVEYLSVLEEVGFKDAKLLISALRIEPTNDLLAFRCWQLKVPSAISVVDLSVTDNLLEMDVKYLMIPKIDGIKLQNVVLKDRGFLPA